MTPNQERALAALISCHTVREAAETAGLTESTLRRYRQNPEFAAEYKRRCAEMLEEATNKAKAGLPLAVERLTSILQDDFEQSREQIAASRAVLEYGLRLIEANDFEKRLRTLEERNKEH